MCQSPWVRFYRIKSGESSPGNQAASRRKVPPGIWDMMVAGRTMGWWKRDSRMHQTHEARSSEGWTGQGAWKARRRAW